MKLTHNDKCLKFWAGQYKCPAPDVHTSRWLSDSWIAHIDRCGVWL